MSSNPIISLADEVSDVIFPEGITDNLYNEIDTVAARQTNTISYLITSRGEHVIANSNRHPRLKIIQAWVEVKDNSNRSQSIEIVGLCKPKAISESYKAGVAVPLTLNKTQINFYKSIRVKAMTDRLVTVNILYESLEELP